MTKFSIQQSDSIRIRSLVNCLKDGIPIGSVCDQDLLAVQEKLNKNPLSKMELDEIKGSISERSSSVWEILNAGWIFKLEFCFEKGETIFFESNGTVPLQDKINEYGKIIDFLDERLLSSINTSQIIKIIEQN